MSARFARILGATVCVAAFGALLWIALHFAGHRSQGSANPDVVGNDNSSASVPSRAFSTAVEAGAPEPDMRLVYRGPKFDSHAHIDADAAMAAKNTDPRRLAHRRHRATA